MIKQKVDHRGIEGADFVLRLGRLRSELDAFQVIGHIVLWAVISMVTLGVGLLFFPYAVAKLILGSIVLTDENGQSTARLRCDINVLEQVGHGVIWLLIIIFSGGLATPFYIFALAHMAIKRTYIISL